MDIPLEQACCTVFGLLVEYHVAAAVCQYVASSASLNSSHMLQLYFQTIQTIFTSSYTCRDVLTTLPGILPAGSKIGILGLVRWLPVMMLCTILLQTCMRLHAYDCY